MRRLGHAHAGSQPDMPTDEKPDPDEQFEKVKDGIGPEQKTSYAPAETGEDSQEQAENVRREIREDRRQADES
jgi:hypothetical protein